LDPLASGLLTVCTGKYTKLIDDIQSGEKVYTGTIVLGCTTPSYDLETEPENPKSTEHVTPEDIERVAHDFGQKLGTGAYLAALRRVSSHPFHVSQSIDLEALLARLEVMP
jgi:tRNA U55 pseudouridine synthase TruB